MNKTISRRHGMICGIYDAEVRKYHSLIDEDGALWLVADQPNMADNIYYCNFDLESQGFAGRTLHFEMVDGETIDLHGPWHSNSDSLFHKTGVDIRDTHITYVVIARNRSRDSAYNTVYEDVLYEDKEPTLGLFDRGDILAKELANKLGTTVYCYRESQGGSSDSAVHPDQKE